MKNASKIFLILVFITSLLSTSPSCLYSQWHQYCYVTGNEVYDVFLKNFLQPVQKSSFEIIRKNKVKKAYCKLKNNDDIRFEVEFNEKGYPTKYSTFDFGKLLTVSHTAFNSNGKIESIKLEASERIITTTYSYNKAGLISKIAFEEDGKIFTSTDFITDGINDSVYTKVITHGTIDDWTETYRYDRFPNGKPNVKVFSDAYGPGQIFDLGFQLGLVNVRKDAGTVLIQENKLLYICDFNMAGLSESEYVKVLLEINKGGFLNPSLLELLKKTNYMGRAMEYDEDGLPEAGSWVDTDMKQILLKYDYEFY